MRRGSLIGPFQNPQTQKLTKPFLYSGFPSIILMFWILERRS